MAAYRSAAWRGVAWRFTKGTRVIRPYTALQIIVVCASDWQLHRKARSDATRVDGRSDAVQLQPCRQSRPWRSGVDCVICVRPSCKRYASWPACVRGMDVAQVEQSNLLSSARPLINSHRQDKMSVSLNKPKETRNKTTQDHRIHLPFTQSLPKIELHAHLNGSIRRSTLASLANAAGLDIRTSQIIHGDARTLPEMFSVFNVIHQCVRGPKILQRITREICQDAETDGIVYLELRTTPRIHKEHNMNEEGYLLAVLNGIKEYTSSGNSIIRLILSIDRKDQPAIALRTIDLAVKYQSQGVVGIDLSGDPSQGEFSSWLPALKRARNFGLKITLHAGEIDERHEEMSQMLAFKPDRLGHVCHISPQNATHLKDLAIPLELCLTSNILTHASTIRSYAEHHFLTHRSHNHPIVLCTDDTAVFGSSLSNEYALAMFHFGLSQGEISDLVRSSLDYSFLSEQDGDYAKVREALLCKLK